MAPSKPKKHILIDASYVASIHTWLAGTAFISALFIGCLLHYKKIVKNGVAGYPQEWFPSVSATIGDWYPERNIFQIFIALASGPRLALVSLQYYLQRSSNSSLPTFVFVSGIVRTLSCGGWVYITSSDDHDVHDVFMITYIVFNIPWMFGGIACTSAKSVIARRRRSYIATAFFSAIVPLVYFFLQHKVHRVPGAYTYYSFFEWSLIFLDVLYDSVTELEFKDADLQISLGFSIGEDEIKSTEPTARNDYKESATAPTTEKIQAATATNHTQEQTDLKKPSDTLWSSLTVLRQPASFLSDVYLSYIFWSIFTSLIPTIFYFSVWELGIAGHELAFLSTLSPILLSIPFLLPWARTRGGLTTLHLLSFSGLAAYVLDKPLHRLFVVAFASAVAVLRQVVEWTGPDAGYQGILMGLGLLVSSLSKHANHSNNPVWPFVNTKSGGYNKTGILLALVALYEFYHRSIFSAPKNQKEKSTSPPPILQSHWLTAAVPLGSLIFSLQTFLADSSTLIAWSWTGYQNALPNGPLPHMHGSLTLITQSLGLLLPLLLSSTSSPSTANTNILSHPMWFLYGTASSYVMYTYKNWLGYAGGLNTAIFLMSIIPTILQRAAATGHVTKTYFTAMLVSCLLTLGSIWTVAYAFVPGGVYLRERTDLVLIAQMACLALAFNWPLLVRNGSVRSSISSSVHLPPMVSSYTRSLLATISVLSVLVTLYRWPQIPRPNKAGPRILTAGIWTIHFGIDNEGRDSQRGVVNLIKDLDLDVVGLLETDLHRVVYGNRDLTRVAVEELGYYVDLGPGPNSHTWGAVLLSKFPIINSTHHLLPSPNGELAPAIEAVLDVFGTEVLVVVSHNGQEEDPLDRELQSTELARIMAAAYPRPTIFLGYVVTVPHASRPAPYEILVTDGRMHDIDKEDLDRWCEYILYRGLYRTSYARVSRGSITDTELQIGRFLLPKYGHSVTNDTDVARYIRSFKEDLPEDHWFPMEYYGNEQEGGVNGHFYHVFYTPLYYNIPEGAVL